MPACATDYSFQLFYFPRSLTYWRVVWHNPLGGRCQAGPDEEGGARTYLTERLLGAAGGTVEPPGSGILVVETISSSYQV